MNHTYFLLSMNRTQFTARKKPFVFGSQRINNKNQSYENTVIAICYAYHAKIVQKNYHQGFCDPNCTTFTRKSVIMSHLAITKAFTIRYANF